MTSLKCSGACSRYLSPTRAPSRSLHGSSSYTHQHTRPTRWHLRASVPNAPSHPTRSISFINKHMPQVSVSTRLVKDAVDGIKNNLRNLPNRLKKPESQPSTSESISTRLMSALNIDLPNAKVTLPKKYHKVLSSALRPKVSENEDTLHNDHPQVQDIDDIQIRQTKLRLQSKIVAENQPREEYDFEIAMSRTDDCIRTYHDTAIAGLRTEGQKARVINTRLKQLEALSSNQSLEPTPNVDLPSVDRTKNFTYHHLSLDAPREEHDFENAMRMTDESVRRFYDATLSSTKGKNTTTSHEKTRAKSHQKTFRRDTIKTPKELKAEAASAAPSTNLVRQLADNVNSMLPTLRSGSNKAVTATKQAEKHVEASQVTRKPLVAKASVDRKTRGLLMGLRTAKSHSSRAKRLEQFCEHLSEYPDTKTVAVREKAIATLLKLRTNKDQELMELAYQGLALVGYVDPLPTRGVRILTLDGGGTKGLMSIEMMKQLEALCGRPMHELFDYICGVSTGSLIAIMLGVYKVPLDECESIYREFSRDMFQTNRWRGAGKLIKDHAYYDTQLWETILSENMGDKTFIDITRDPECPKISAVSCLVNTSRLENHLFRNYTLAPGVQSHYPGGMQYKLWEAVRASSAAPGYYSEKKIGDSVHQDGGVMTNNPTAIAIHESKLLWPSEPLQCVVSIGTGRYESTLGGEGTAEYTSLKQKVFKVLESATDTEAVHIVLHDLLPPSTYFRFNPYTQEDFILDETSEDKWDQMKHDTQMYCRKNEHKLQKATQRLMEQRKPMQKAADWLKTKQDMYG